jgi:hypothetical protein
MQDTELINDVKKPTATPSSTAVTASVVGEATCEMRNLFLDRSLIVPTMADRLPLF